MKRWWGEMGKAEWRWRWLGCPVVVVEYYPRCHIDIDESWPVVLIDYYITCSLQTPKVKSLQMVRTKSRVPN